MLESIHHIVLFCKETELSKEWYEKVGFTYVNGFDGMHWFKLGGTYIMLHPSDTTNPGMTAIHAGVHNVEEMFQHVVSQGLEPLDHQQDSKRIDAPVERPWGDVEFELVDPDGHQWAFTQIK
ncbi:VOC family protein [Bacillus salitolerans]|uniref:VOC family protein n=1 Tax=Bacillus salitolerans TaxID=1437434 RepID=A0ABW4LWW7_9BACI